MRILVFLGLMLASYLLGAVPFGLIIVKLLTGKDIRQVESGRTGGTNVARAAGFWPGLLTALLDMFKAACTVWLARVLLPLESDSMNAWFHIFPPIAAILGHNYSIFLARRAINGRLRLHGGAGGASCVGGSFGLWEPSVLLIIPIAGLILYFVGYASIATLCVGLLSTILFTILATFNILPWQYVLYGILSEVILVWSLRPNISRLLRGSERLIGFRARNGKAVVKNT